MDKEDIKDKLDVIRDHISLIPSMVLELCTLDAQCSRYYVLNSEICEKVMLVLQHIHLFENYLIKSNEKKEDL